MPPCRNVLFQFPFVFVKIPLFFLRYGNLRHTGNWKLGTWWDFVQLPATQFVVEVCYFLDGRLWIPS